MHATRIFTEADMIKEQADSLITSYMQKIYGFAIKKSFSYDEAEELCAEMLGQVYASLIRAEEVINPDAFIRRICQHTYAKYLSRKKRREGISLDGVGAPEIPYFEDFLGRDEREGELALLRREVAFLTRLRRQVVYAFYYENRPISAIAKSFGIPEGTVKWHLNRARNELKEGFTMERKIGKLGLNPVKAVEIGHNGNTGSKGGPEYYLSDRLNLNIVYSVYFEPRTRESIAEELGVTPVFIEDRIDMLEENGFLVRTKGDRYTTYVRFFPRTYSLERTDAITARQLEAAEILADEYAPLVRKALTDAEGIYIPGGRRQPLEAAVITRMIADEGWLPITRDLERYHIRTTDGGDYNAGVHLEAECIDPDYKPIHTENYSSCGSMTRISCKYPAVSSWSIDSSRDSRVGYWQNNLTADYEYLYEYMRGELADNSANAEKLTRLRERGFLSGDGRIGIMIVKDSYDSFFARVPKIDDGIKSRFADFALECAMIEAKDYPPQMQDLVISCRASGFIGGAVALMTVDKLIERGIFTPFTEEEKVTVNLLMFSDILPQ